MEDDRMSTTTIPVSITEEAARRVALLGMHRELDAMLEWTRDNVPDLQAIIVTPSVSRRALKATLIIINAHCNWNEEHSRTVPIECDWADWKVQTFPPRVCANFIMSSTFQPVPAA
jgi:hypothetical protein